MPRAFVTGITGQTGSYLAELLAGTGWDVHGLVRPSDGGAAQTRSLIPTARLHRGDLSDTDTLHRLVDEIEPDAIFNLGGLSSVAASWQHPVETARITAVPVAALLEAAWGLQERRGTPVAFVQASSAEIFGSPDRSPQDELTPVRPSNPYGAAKAYGHHLVGLYRARGLGASSCILFNHESPRRPPSFVTRKVTRAAARIALGLQDVVDLGNLDARRDWGWAPDYARAVAGAAVVPGDYVIATGESHSVREFVAAAFLAAGVEDWEPHVHVDRSLVRPTDAAEQAGDSTKARTVLGWEPTKTFHEIVAEMVEADLAEARSQG